MYIGNVHTGATGAMPGKTVCQGTNESAKKLTTIAFCTGNGICSCKFHVLNGAIRLWGIAQAHQAAAENSVTSVSGIATFDIQIADSQHGVCAFLRLDSQIIVIGTANQPANG